MKTFLLIPLILFSVGAFGQTKISGTVTSGNGEPVPMANILLLDTYDGASADINGYFEFTTAEIGVTILVIRSMGFKESRVSVELTGNPIKIKVDLDELINELEAVTISAGAFAASDESRRTVFKAVDIATVAGATADIAGALNTLPGTQKVGESGRLFVRGGDGNETRTFIDGMVVFDAYNASSPNAPSRGRFLPFMFKGTSFSTGGYSSEYGQALSSALALDSKDKSESTRTDFGLLSVGGDVSHTQAWETGSIAGKIQYTNLKPYTGIINQKNEWKTAPNSIEGITSFRQQVGKDGMFKLYGNFNRSNFAIFNYDIDDVDLKQLYELDNNYNYVNASYKDVLNKNWMVRAGVSYSFIDNDVRIETRNISEVEKGIHAKTVFEGSLSDKLELKTGLEIINRNYKQQYNADHTNAFEELLVASFVEADVYTSNRFVTRAGARLEYNSLLEKLSVDPRVSMAYKTGDFAQFSFAYGQFRQSPKNEWIRTKVTLASEKASHFILNYQRIENNKTFRIETYYKKYSDLVSFQHDDPTVITNEGHGFAKGIELFWRDNESIQNVDYWISYSYLDTKRDYLDFPGAFAPSFASKHNFSAVYKHFIVPLKSQVGFTFSYASGRPYYNPNNSKFHGDRTPHYADLSFNWSYLPKPNLIVYFSCSNLLGRNNVFGYEYSNKLNEESMYNSRAIEQPAKRFLFIGIFLTLTKDKSVNQLPTL
jgi:hypothetical protein